MDAFIGVATFCRVKAAFSSIEVALPVAAEEGFTGVLEGSRGTESRNCYAFADAECLREFQTDDLLKIDGEGRCIITDHAHFGMQTAHYHNILSFTLNFSCNVECCQSFDLCTTLHAYPNQ